MNASSFLADSGGLPNSVHDAATTLLWTWLQTDVTLTHAPSQVALAALVHSATPEHRPSLDRYVTEKIEAVNPERAAPLRVALEAITKEASDARVGPSPPKQHDQLKRTLQMSRHPLYDPDSNIYKQRKQVQEAEREAKRRKRDEEWRAREASQLQSILGT